MPFDGDVTDTQFAIVERSATPTHIDLSTILETPQTLVVAGAKAPCSRTAGSPLGAAQPTVISRVAFTRVSKLTLRPRPSTRSTPTI
jgi:hypothetical protein